MTQGSNKLHFFCDAQNKPTTVRFNGTDYFYVCNLQGDVVAMIDFIGTQMVEYHVDVCGAPVAETGSMADTLGTVNPFRYRGYVYAEELDLYYVGNRYYDAKIKRFINSDDAFNLGANAGILSYNLFAYCSDNPCERIDVDGDYWETALDVAAQIADVIDVAANPTNPIAWGALVFDVACTILPGITGGGGIVRVVTTADKLGDAAKYADEIVDATKAIITAKHAGSIIHQTYDPLQKPVDGDLRVKSMQA